MTFVAAAFVACAVSALSGGCAGGELQPVKGMDEFRQEVLAASEPVMMTFEKDGCATCIVLEPKMDKLAKEYSQRGVKFTKMNLMSFFFVLKEKEVAEQYDVTMFPTVVLFVDGAETRRWIMRYNVDSYRQALDEVAKPPPATQPVE